MSPALATPNGVSLSDWAEALDTVLLIINNVLAHPDQERYYRVNLLNKHFHDRLGRKEGGLQLLHSIGFQPDETQTAGLQLPKDIDKQSLEARKLEIEVALQYLHRKIDLQESRDKEKKKKERSGMKTNQPLKTSSLTSPLPVPPSSNVASNATSSSTNTRKGIPPRGSENGSLALEEEKRRRQRAEKLVSAQRSNLLTLQHRVEDLQAAQEDLAGMRFEASVGPLFHSPLPTASAVTVTQKGADMSLRVSKQPLIEDDWLNKLSARIIAMESNLIESALAQSRILRVQEVRGFRKSTFLLIGTGQEMELRRVVSVDNQQLHLDGPILYAQMRGAPVRALKSKGLTAAAVEKVVIANALRSLLLHDLVDLAFAKSTICRKAQSKISDDACDFFDDFATPRFRLQPTQLLPSPSSDVITVSEDVSQVFLGQGCDLVCASLTTDKLDLLAMFHVLSSHNQTSFTVGTPSQLRRWGNVDFQLLQKVMEAIPSLRALWNTLSLATLQSSKSLSWLQFLFIVRTTSQLVNDDMLHQLKEEDKGGQDDEEDVCIIGRVFDLFISEGEVVLYGDQVADLFARLDDGRLDAIFLQTRLRDDMLLDRASLLDLRRSYCSSSQICPSLIGSTLHSKLRDWQNYIDFTLTKTREDSCSFQSGFVPHSRFSNPIKIVQVEVDEVRQRVLSLDIEGVMSVMDLRSGALLYRQRLLFVEPVPAAAVEGFENFLPNSDPSASAAAARCFYSLPLPASSSSCKSGQPFAFDQETGLLVVNAALPSNSLAVHECVALRRLYRLRYPLRLSSRLQTYGQHPEQQEGVRSSDCRGVPQQMSILGYRALLLLLPFGAQEVLVLSLQTGAVLSTLGPFKASLSTISFSNGCLLAGAEDGAVRFWRSTSLPSGREAMLQNEIGTGRAERLIENSTGPFANTMGSVASSDGDTTIRNLVQNVLASIDIAPVWQIGRVSHIMRSSAINGSNNTSSRFREEVVEVVFSDGSLRLYSNRSLLRDIEEVKRAPRGPPLWRRAPASLSRDGSDEEVAVYDYVCKQVVQALLALQPIVQAPKTPEEAAKFFFSLPKVSAVLTYDEVYAALTRSLGYRSSVGDYGREEYPAFSLEDVVDDLLRCHCAGKMIKHWAGRLLVGAHSAVRALAYSAAGRWAVALDSGGIISVWDLSVRAVPCIYGLKVGNPPRCLVSQLSLPHEMVYLPSIFHNRRNGAMAIFPCSLPLPLLQRALQLDLHISGSSQTRLFLYLFEDLSYEVLSVQAFCSTLVTLDCLSDARVAATSSTSMSRLERVYRDRSVLKKVFFICAQGNREQQEVVECITRCGLLQVYQQHQEEEVRVSNLLAAAQIKYVVFPQRELPTHIPQLNLAPDTFYFVGYDRRGNCGGALYPLSLCRERACSRSVPSLLFSEEVQEESCATFFDRYLQEIHHWNCAKTGSLNYTLLIRRQAIQRCLRLSRIALLDQLQRCTSSPSNAASGVESVESYSLIMLKSQQGPARGSYALSILQCDEWSQSATHPLQRYLDQLVTLGDGLALEEIYASTGNYLSNDFYLLLLRLSAASLKRVPPLSRLGLVNLFKEEIQLLCSFVSSTHHSGGKEDATLIFPSSSWRESSDVIFSQCALQHVLRPFVTQMERSSGLCATRREDLVLQRLSRELVEPLRQAVTPSSLQAGQSFYQAFDGATMWEDEEAGEPLGVRLYDIVETNDRPAHFPGLKSHIVTAATTYTSSILGERRRQERVFMIWRFEDERSRRLLSDRLDQLRGVIHRLPGSCPVIRPLDPLAFTLSSASSAVFDCSSIAAVFPWRSSFVSLAQLLTLNPSPGWRCQQAVLLALAAVFLSLRDLGYSSAIISPSTVFYDPSSGRVLILLLPPLHLLKEGVSDDPALRYLLAQYLSFSRSQPLLYLFISPEIHRICNVSSEEQYVASRPGDDTILYLLAAFVALIFFGIPDPSNEEIARYSLCDAARCWLLHCLDKGGAGLEGATDPLCWLHEDGVAVKNVADLRATFLSHYLACSLSPTGMALLWERLAYVLASKSVDLLADASDISDASYVSHHYGLQLRDVEAKTLLESAYAVKKSLRQSRFSDSNLSDAPANSHDCRRALDDVIKRCYKVFRQYNITQQILLVLLEGLLSQRKLTLEQALALPLFQAMQGFNQSSQREEEEEFQGEQEMFSFLPSTCVGERFLGPLHQASQREPSSIDELSSALALLTTLFDEIPDPRKPRSRSHVVRGIPHGHILDTLREAMKLRFLPRLVALALRLLHRSQPLGSALLSRLLRTLDHLSISSLLLNAVDDAVLGIWSECMGALLMAYLGQYTPYEVLCPSRAFTLEISHLSSGFKWSASLSKMLNELVQKSSGQNKALLSGKSITSSLQVIEGVSSRWHLLSYLVCTPTEIHPVFLRGSVYYTTLSRLQSHYATCSAQENSKNGPRVRGALLSYICLLLPPSPVPAVLLATEGTSEELLVLLRREVVMIAPSLPEVLLALMDFHIPSLLHGWWGYEEAVVVEGLLSFQLRLFIFLAALREDGQGCGEVAALLHAVGRAFSSQAWIVGLTTALRRAISSKSPGAENQLNLVLSILRVMSWSSYWTRSWRSAGLYPLLYSLGSGTMTMISERLRRDCISVIADCVHRPLPTPLHRYTAIRSEDCLASIHSLLHEVQDLSLGSTLSEQLAVTQKLTLLLRSIIHPFVHLLRYSQSIVCHGDKRQPHPEEEGDQVQAIKKLTSLLLPLCSGLPRLYTALSSDMGSDRFASLSVCLRAQLLVIEEVVNAVRCLLASCSSSFGQRLWIPILAACLYGKEQREIEDKAEREAVNAIRGVLPLCSMLRLPRAPARAVHHIRVLSSTLHLLCSFLRPHSPTAFASATVATISAEGIGWLQGGAQGLCRGVMLFLSFLRDCLSQPAAWAVYAEGVQVALSTLRRVWCVLLASAAKHVSVAEEIIVQGLLAHLAASDLLMNSSAAPRLSSGEALYTSPLLLRCEGLAMLHAVVLHKDICRGDIPPGIEALLRELGDQIASNGLIPRVVEELRTLTNDSGARSNNLVMREKLRTSAEVLLMCTYLDHGEVLDIMQVIIEPRHKH